MKRAPDQYGEWAAQEHDSGAENGANQELLPSAWPASRVGRADQPLRDAAPFLGARQREHDRDHRDDLHQRERSRGLEIGQLDLAVNLDLERPVRGIRK